jgi:hypothetical protein
LEWLSEDKQWLTAWVKKKAGSDYDIRIKVKGPRSGMRIAIIRQVIVRALNQCLLANVADSTQRDASKYLESLSSVRFNAMFECTSLVCRQGVNCLYSDVNYVGVIDGRKQAMMADKNYKGIVGIYLKPEYVYLIKDTEPDAYKFYSLDSVE